MEEFIYDVLNQDRWWWTVGRRSLVRSLTRRHVGSENQLKLLDIGCGTGTNLETLQDYGTVHGMDVSPIALSHCRDRGIDRICRGDAAHLPFRDNLFDIVIGVDVLEHLEDDDAALREIHRVCRPRAILIAIVPAFRFLWSHRDEQHHHKRRYRIRQLRERMTRGGFTVNRMTYVNLFLLPPLFLLARLERLTPRRLNRNASFGLLPALLNRPLGWLMQLEAAWLRYADLPIGTSVACVAKSRDEDNSASQESRE